VSAWTAVPHRKSWDCWVTLTSAPETVAPSGILDDHFEVAGAMLLDAFVGVLDVSAVAPPPVTTPRRPARGGRGGAHRLHVVAPVHRREVVSPGFGFVFGNDLDVPGFVFAIVRSVSY